MKIVLKTFLFILLFVCTFIKSEAKGRDVVIFLKDGTKKYGELINVRDSIIITTQALISNDEEIVGFAEALNITFVSDIGLINIVEEPRNDTFQAVGIGIGGAIGFITSMVINDGSVLLSIVPSFIGMIPGAIIGFGAGEAARGHAEGFYLKKSEDLLKLKSHARFKESEPTYLRDVIDNLLQETK